MHTPILATKLYLPPSPPSGVRRPRLIERLNQGLQRKLSLISAPAGFGKTTLVSEWAAGQAPIPSAWLSLDEADSDPARFLAYLLAAIQTAAPGLGEDLARMLQAGQPLAVEPLLIALLNQIAGLPGKLILVLDDYHMIEAQAVDQAVAYLIEHQPPQLHLVITTREDPQLPLARLRARGQMTELRAADLRFTPGEAAEFLQEMGIRLSAQDVAALDERTEGWIAGLQLAALTMQGQQDIHEFIQAFAGDHRYIMDYLVEEVLQRQPESTRGFLLQTAILSQLSGPLCDAVTGQAGGSARLETLQRGNFFIVPLDDKRQWYRYHHLFAEVLQAYLLAEQPGLVPELHRRASAWFEQHGPPADAIRHALAAGDFERAAGLVEAVFPEISRARQEALLLGWLKALPAAVVRQRPVLCNLYAGVLMQHGILEDVEGWLQAAEDGLEAAGERAVVNESEFQRLPAAIAIHRAGLALMHGDLASTKKHARRSLDLAPRDDYLRRGGAAGLLGLALWTGGALEEAQSIFSDGILYLRKAGHFSDAAGLSLAQADVQLALGHPREALETYQRTLRHAEEQGTPALRGTADMLVGMSEVLRERGELAAAEQYLQSSEEMGEQAGLPQNRYRWCAALALLRANQGQLDEALALLDEAERLYAGDFSPYVRPVAAIRARIQSAHNRLAEAEAWARSRSPSASDELSYLREYEHITLARILLARGMGEGDSTAVQEAVGLLERLLAAAEAGCRTRSVVETRVLLALALEASGEANSALAHLEQALSLAEPEGYARLFVDEGPPMEHLLREAAARGMTPAYTGKLLAAFHPDPGGQPADEPSPEARAQARSAAEMRPPPAELSEPLSQRELEVLRLFRTELSGPEIAQELMVALSTVRTHTKSIYSKLQVNNRRAAVNRAVELHLI